MVRETPTGRYRGTTLGIDLGAKDLRRRMTPAEAILWQELRRNQLDGLGFRRQHPVGPFVLDFYCAACKLAVEVDGAVHDEQREQDTCRTEHLAAYGYRLLRFRNEEVLTNLPSVLARIAETARALLKDNDVAAESPSPPLGGGVGEGATAAHKGATPK